ncbi:MAG: hypothetical protein RBS08_02850 [Bdellovibrionales bacterium]|jgi:hypothetical protein|nr:hypothetical protein [Bdellovibrionales bacterium]
MMKNKIAIAALTLTAAFAGAAAYGLKDHEFKSPLASPEESKLVVCVDTKTPALHTLDTGETVIVRSLFAPQTWEFTDKITQQKKRITAENIANMECASLVSPIKPAAKTFGR